MDQVSGQNSDLIMVAQMSRIGLKLIHLLLKEYVSISIDFCPWQDPMQLAMGIKVKGTPHNLSSGRVKWLDIKQSL